MLGRLTQQAQSPAGRLLVVAASTALALATAGAAARAGSQARHDTIGPYSLELRALTGPQGADVLLTTRSDTGTTQPATLKKVQLKVFAADGSVADVRNLKDVALEDGAVDFQLGQVPRNRHVEADVLIQTPPDAQTYVLRGEATTRLRPDLQVSVFAPPQTTTSRPIDVVADVKEANGDTDATATVMLMLGPTPLAPPASVRIPAGGTTSVTFAGVKLPSPVVTELTALVDAASPAETDTTNNVGTRSVDVTENELPTPKNVLFPALIGYGAQFGMHVYAPITPWPPGLGYGDFEDKVKALEPQLVRIFYNDNWDANANGQFPDWQTNYASFVDVVQLAQEAGATIDISFQNLGNARSNPGPSMAKFADVLEELVRDHGLTNVRWAEVGNEPNSGGVANTSLDEYNALYRELNAQLVTRGLRDHIQLMGGGLVENAGVPTRTHYVWMQWIGANMADVVDGYAEHVYWTYNDSGRLEYRLRDTAHLMNEVLPPEQRKPTYMMEFGIRGFNTCGTKPPLPVANQLYYRDENCTDIWRTNIAGFQQLWFYIDSAQLGVAGASKWDAYWSRYDRSSVNNQFHWTIGPPTEGSPLTPTYYALSLLFHTTVPGWQIIGIEPWDESDSGVPTYGIEGHTSNDQPEKELTAYAGPNGELTIVGLDTHGKDLNTVSTEAAPEYSIGGLPANATLNLALWNATGDGTNSIAGPVLTNAAGVARFHVPLQAAFDLTTVAIS